MRLIAWMKDMSLRKKLLVLFVFIGLVPLVVTFFVSYGEVRKYALEGLDYTSNQTYEQTLKTLTNKLSYIEEISSLIMINPAINSVLSRDPLTTEIHEQLSLFSQVTEYTQILETNSEFDHIIYYIRDEFVVAGSNAVFYRPLSGIAEEAWVREIYGNRGEPIWIVAEEQFGTVYSKYLALTRALWNPNDYMDPIGILMIRVNLDDIQELLQKAVPDQLVYVETVTGELVASSGEAELAVMRLDAPVEQAAYTEVQLDGGTYLARGDRIGSTNLHLSSVISQEAATETVNRVRLQLLIVYSTVSLIVLLLIVLITRSVTSRVLMLKNKMTQARQGKLEEIHVEPRGDEIGHLIASYNYMINSVKELLREQYTLGQEKKGAELRALQSQINPHFLYNTLDMLIWMANREETENMKQVIYALSDYYKLVLSKGQDLVTVGVELRICEVYMDIQMRRFKNRIRFRTEVEAAAMHCLLPKITLQPLVENAIIHGIFEKPEKTGTVVVRGRVEHNRLILTVEDDGVGMQEDHEKQSGYRGSGYGVRNISKRLELYYSESNSIRFKSQDGGGTCVTIDVPAVTD